MAEEQAATDVHRNTVIKHFYHHTIRDRLDTYVSHTACFACLFESPEHVLPCGHALCTRCLKGSGIAIMRNVIEIRQCPIDGKDFSEGPWTVVLKPQTSGVRILTLDGYVLFTFLNLFTTILVSSSIEFHSGRLAVNKNI